MRTYVRLGLLLAAVLALAVLAEGSRPAASVVTGVDSDNDGFDDDMEVYLGTDPLDNCPDDPTDDAWPLDKNNDTWLNAWEILAYDLVGVTGLMYSDPEWSPAVQRFDLNGDGAVTIVADMFQSYAGMTLPVQCDGVTPHHVPNPQGAPVTMGIDPDITGNSASTLGDLEACVRVNVAPGDLGDGEADHTIDVYVTGDGAAQPPIGYDAWVVYNPARVGIPEWAQPTTLTADCGPGEHVWCDVGDASRFRVWITGVQLGPPNAEVDWVSDVDLPNNRVEFRSLDYAHSSGDPVYPPGVDDTIKLPHASSLTREMPSRLSAAAVYFSGYPGTAGDGTIVRMHLDAKSAGPACFTLPFAKAYTSPEPFSLIHPTVGRAAALAINQECPADSDADTVVDICDVCPNDPGDDADNDGICAGSGYLAPKTGDNDNCMYDDNPLQDNHDDDAAGDACDCDDDNDGTPDNQEIRDDTDPFDSEDYLPPDTDDSDSDGALNWEEDWCGTDPNDECGDDCNPTPPPAGTLDAWAYDINIDCWSNAADILMFPANVNMPVQLGDPLNPTFQCRYDLDPDNWINAQDILMLPARVLPSMPKQCTNP